MTDIEKIILFVILLICLGAGLVFIFLGCLKKRNIELVLENSQMIKSLNEINNVTHFAYLKSCYTYHHVCNTKRQLDNFSLNEYLLDLIDINEDFYKDIIKKVEFNKKLYDLYTAQIGKIESTASRELCKNIKISYNKFVLYENREFEKTKLQKPQIDVFIYCKATYTSPSKRNHYCKDRRYSIRELKEYLITANRRREQKAQRQFQIKSERAKMTDSLRYDILKRDGFRCQICGSTAQDGVKLHVDHIMPVSKGGLTTPSNLRTLCDRCNMGKSDKM